MHNKTDNKLISSGCQRKTVTFNSHGETLEAYIYLPTNAAKDGPLNKSKIPAVVTAPGFGGVKEMLIDSYAVPLAEASIACLSLDYRYFGGSSGKPRQYINPLKQVEDIKAGLDYLQSVERIDPSRLGVWGTSMSGGHTVTVAATDPRVKAAVAIIPFLLSGKPSGNMSAILHAVAQDGIGRMFGREASTIPIFAETEGAFAVMASDGGWDWMQGITEYAPNYKNEVTLQSLMKVRTYQPKKYARQLSVPTLFMAAESDSITPAKPIRKFVDKVTCEKDYLEYPDSHFELFGAHLSDTAEQTVRWFQKHL